MRPLKKINKIILILLIASHSSVLLAQQGFRYQAALPKVDSAAFYQVDLPPELLAKCKTDLSDIRIVDAKNVVAPYIFGSRQPVNNKVNFVVFRSVPSNSNIDTLTTLVVENKLNVAIDQLTLRLRNTAVQRMVTLSGSDDLLNWYAIKENITLNDASGTGNHRGIYEQALNFPTSTYRFYKIQINNQRKGAVNIVQAGIYRFQLIKPVYIKLPKVSLVQSDGADYSTVRVKLNDSYRLNKLHLAISGAKFYNRGLSIYDVTGKQRTLLADTILSSNSNGDIFVTAKTKSIELRIVNGDNPPVSVKSIEAYSLSQSIVSYLYPQKTYNLLLGNPGARPPNYDLEIYVDSVQQNIAVIQPGKVDLNPLFHSKQVSESKGIARWVIWASIVAALIILSALTYKMVKEIELKKSSNAG